MSKQEKYFGLPISYLFAYNTSQVAISFRSNLEVISLELIELDCYILKTKIQLYYSPSVFFNLIIDFLFVWYSAVLNIYRLRILQPRFCSQKFLIDIASVSKPK